MHDPSLLSIRLRRSPSVGSAVVASIGERGAPFSSVVYVACGSWYADARARKACDVRERFVDQDVAYVERTTTNSEIIHFVLDPCTMYTRGGLRVSPLIYETHYHYRNGLPPLQCFKMSVLDSSKCP